MTALYLLEPDRPGAAWAPFAGVRPIAELRAGAWRVRERWEAACAAETAAILGDHADGFSEGDEPPVRPPAPVEGPAVIGASWFAPSGERSDRQQLPRARPLVCLWDYCCSEFSMP